MTTSKSLPARPSLESLRKQAKKLARERSLSQRNAQLVLAREYGYAGWQDLTAEVSKRLGKGLDWAVAQARRIIHDNDVDGLKQLLAKNPALLSWRADDKDDGLLGMATGAYGDAGDAQREQWFTRGACAELLIDAGAVVMPSVCEGILQSRARGLLKLFQRKGVLPRTLKFFAALGDIDAVRAALDEKENDPAAVNEAFVRACLFDHEAVGSLLLERSIALDPELGTNIDGRVGRSAFTKYFIEARPEIVREIGGQAVTIGLWKAFVMEQVSRAVLADNLTEFVSGLQREPWLLDDEWVDFQARLIATAALNDRGAFIVALLDLDPAILRRQPPPLSQAIEFAFTYAKTHLIPLLTRIWPLPDDLPHAAGMGDLARVKRWFDESGAPALGDLEKHFPCNDPHTLKHDDLQWGAPTAQHVLDSALAWAVINRHFDVADFLLEHGADVSTNWNSHEPASILHHLVFLPNPYESMQFLVDRGIDMTIKDHRWNATAAGWARHAANDEKMAQWLEEKAKSAFLDFVRLVVNGDIVEVSRRLAASPSLATVPAEVGATRKGAASFFLAEIAHYLYAGDTALHMAAAAFRRPIAELLMAHGADCHARNRRGAEPLHYAADANRWEPAAQAETIEYLVSAGADPNGLDDSGVAPLHRAVRTRSLPAVRALLDGGANPKAPNKSGSTPLHLAVQSTGRGGSGSEHAREQQAGIIRLLLERGARPTDTDGRGRQVREAATSEWVRALLVGGSGQ